LLKRRCTDEKLPVPARCPSRRGGLRVWNRRAGVPRSVPRAGTTLTMHTRLERHSPQGWVRGGRMVVATRSASRARRAVPLQRYSPQGWVRGGRMVVATRSASRARRAVPLQRYSPQGWVCIGRMVVATHSKQYNATPFTSNGEPLGCGAMLRASA